MSEQNILRHLATLVAFDTQNPPRDLHGNRGIFAYCRHVLDDAFDVRVWEHGEGHVTLLAVRGAPRVLFNVHLDTVPNGEGWSSDPLTLRVAEGKAFGRGACDIKCAAACLLAIAESAPGHMALLLTSDEEGSSACCVRHFLESGEGRRFEQIVVAEPTRCQAVLGHRGFIGLKGWFRGPAGHSSEARALKDNAIHQMSRWAAKALDLAAGRIRSAQDPGPCLNIGIARGGTKSNVIAGEAFVHWSARLKPGESSTVFLREMEDCAPAGANVEWDTPHVRESLPVGEGNRERAEAFATRHGLAVAGDVDFWTEAAIFSEFGLPALVLGPGNIAQAHMIDEWVAVSDLSRAFDIYRRVISEEK